MNNSKTPKIVVGVGLAAVYATIAAFVIPRGTQDNVVAQAAPVGAPAELASEPALPPAVASETAEAAGVTGEPATIALATVPASPAAPDAAVATAEVSKQDEVSKQAEVRQQREVEPQMAAQPVASQEPVAEDRAVSSIATTPPAAQREVEDPNLASAGSAAPDESDAAAVVTSQDGAGAVDEAGDTAAAEPGVLGN